MCVPVDYFRRMRRRLYKQVLFLDVGRNFFCICGQEWGECGLFECLGWRGPA